MGKTMLKAGALLETYPSSRIIRRKAMMKQTNDFTKLPTSEIFRRIYKRHIVGVWQAVAVVLVVAFIWSLTT